MSAVASLRVRRPAPSYRGTIGLCIIGSLAGCAGSLPTVDGKSRRPINNPETVGMLSQRALAVGRSKDASFDLWTTEDDPASGAMTYKTRVLFPVNGTTFRPTKAQEEELRTYLPRAQRIELRGRTDGQRSNPNDEAVALRRALSAKRYLIDHGVSPMIIDVNYLSAGDYIDDNHTPEKRAQNRRVDIDILCAPTTASATTATSAPVVAGKTSSTQGRKVTKE